ncbi:hypothetical protein E2C01_071542 [Portunus trituberculatus]|uniref:Uncharacterized protein n=1 Tax=Portunus trituberculatus TaxID=210409 RepID=A0A5B7I6H4_PORTR|nr:hypothetical protein [Portunus trituberculatus]
MVGGPSGTSNSPQIPSILLITFAQVRLFSHERFSPHGTCRKVTAWHLEALCRLTVRCLPQAIPLDIGFVRQDAAAATAGLSFHPGVNTSIE